MFFVATSLSFTPVRTLRSPNNFSFNLLSIISLFCYLLLIFPKPSGLAYVYLNCLILNLLTVESFFRFSCCCCCTIHCVIIVFRERILNLRRSHGRAHEVDGSHSPPRCSMEWLVHLYPMCNFSCLERFSGEFPISGKHDLYMTSDSMTGFWFWFFFIVEARETTVERS